MDKGCDCDRQGHLRFVGVEKTEMTIDRVVEQDPGEIEAIHAFKTDELEASRRQEIREFEPWRQDRTLGGRGKIDGPFARR